MIGPLHFVTALVTKKNDEVAIALFDADEVVAILLCTSAAANNLQEAIGSALETPAPQ